MTDGYFQYDNEADVIQYIAEVLQPQFDDAGVPFKWVYILRPHYDLFVIPATEEPGYAGLTLDQKQVLYQRFQDQIGQQQAGGAPFVAAPYGTIALEKITGQRKYILTANIIGVPAGVTIREVEWQFERAPDTGLFDVHRYTKIVDAPNAFTPMTKANADIVFADQNWLKYKWHTNASVDTTTSLYNILWGYEGATYVSDKKILARVKIFYSNGSLAEAFTFLTV